jgi:hypothetical protein
MYIYKYMYILYSYTYLHIETQGAENGVGVVKDVRSVEEISRINSIEVSLNSYIIYPYLMYI